jgi:8-oxo-dGTP diphosphatase
MPYTYDYPRPAVTADCVVMTKESVPHVLLIERGNDPFKGCWAFPGGFMDMDETTEHCAIRELKEETGLVVEKVLQIGAYSNVDRDPRGRTVSVAYLAVIDKPVDVTGQDDAAKAQWFPIDALPPLAFDHEDIMNDAIVMYNQMQSFSLENSQKIAEKFAKHKGFDITELCAEKDGYKYYQLMWNPQPKYTGHPNVIKIAPTGRVIVLEDREEIYWAVMQLNKSRTKSNKNKPWEH